MPQDFDFPSRTDLWEPIATDPQSLDCWCYSTIGRLAPGRTPHDAARDIALLTDAFWRDREPGGKKAPDPESEPESRVVAASLASSLVGGIRTPLLVLFGAVGLVLLIACANVANLLLVRATTRSREIAVRTCLGAGPWRVARQLLLESLLLGLGSGLLGLACAVSGIQAIERLVAGLVSPVEPIALDLPALGFTAVVMFASVALFGLAPAIRGARVDLQATLKDGGRATRSPVRHLNDAFVVVQLSLSLVLLVGAGLLLRSLGNLVAVDPGFRADGVLVGRTVLPPLGYGDPARVRAFYDELARRVRGLAGVVSAGFSSSAPFSAGDNGQNFTIRGREPRPGEPTLVAAIRAVTAGYFRAIGTPLRLGRPFEPNDTDTAPLVAIVDETLAHRYWPDGNAVGNEVRLGDGPWRRIVGVAASVRYKDLSEDPHRFIYLPHAQAPAPEMDLVVRTSGAPAALTKAIRSEIGRLDAAVPFYEVHTLTSAVARSLGARRLTDALLLAFALAALVLAASGIYGTMALNVGQRVNEFGVRQALGAARGDILRLVLSRGMRLVSAGVALGRALGTARAIRGLLFHVTPLDPLNLALVALLLGAVAMLACYLPALRATRVEPLRALRCD